MKFAAAAAALLLVLFAAASAKRAALRSPLAQALSSNGGVSAGQEDAQREMVQVAAPAAAWGLKRLVVVLSDIHIGDGSPTQNYQSHVHEGHLLAIMDDVVARNEPIAEVVLAGDIFEFWYYPFHAQPPSLATILAANPNLFGPTSGFSCVLDAPGGCVTFIPCNHDMHLTAADVAQIRSPGGHYVKFAARSYNAGGDTSNLPPNTTAGDLPNLGTPSSSKASSYLLPILLGIQAGNYSVAPQVLDAYARFYGANQSAEIIMLDRTTTTITEAKQEYALLFQKWIAENGGGAGGVQVALKVLWADIDSTYMGWFATKQALESGASLVAYGHTHVPVRGLVNPVLANYINHGFECAGAPDLVSGSKVFSFLTIDRHAHAAGQPQEGAAQRRHGRFVLLPTSIKAGTRAAVWVQDFPAPPITAGVAASEAWLTYIAKKTAKARAGEYKKTWKFAFACPTSRMNSASGGSSLVAKSGFNPCQATVPQYRYPLYVLYTI
ncbi:unnamed protein product [Closterium sp. NIES-64]|nr:unnamed protein product [Closterium sp. NIES-64]